MSYIASVQIVIDRSSSRAPFSQVISQIAAAVGTGDLEVGARLPPVRDLAAQLGVAPGTVARAYRELEISGLVDTRGRHGTYVSDPEMERTVHRRRLADLAATYARTATQFGIRPSEAIDLVDQALRGTRPDK